MIMHLASAGTQNGAIWRETGALRQRGNGASLAASTLCTVIRLRLTEAGKSSQNILSERERNNKPGGNGTPQEQWRKTTFVQREGGDLGQFGWVGFVVSKASSKLWTCGRLSCWRN